MKVALGLGLAVAGFVVSLAAPAGALAPVDTGKIVIKNATGNIINMSPTVDPELYSIFPGRTLVIRGVGRFDNVGIDFDADGDLNVDTTYSVNLNGSKVGKFTVGQFGLASITVQQ